MSDQLSLFGGQVVPTRPTKPALRFYGGKWSLAEWIVSHFPHGFERMHYVEPFGGSAGVLIWKPPSFLETYNDLDFRLVTFFRVIRERRDDLVRVLKSTPFSREEYRTSYKATPDELETARNVFISLYQSIGGTPGRLSGWRVQRAIDARYTSSANEWVRAVDNLDLIAGRFRAVQIENLPAIELIRRTDSPDTLFYVDPPYPMETRGSKGKSYSYEMGIDDHRRLAESLAGVRGFVVLSSYRTQLYDGLFSNWVRVDRETRTNSGGSAVESLYLSPRFAAEPG